MLLLLLVLLIGTTTAEQRRQVIAKAESSIRASDWLEGGSCGDAAGCRREVVTALAVIPGQPFDADGCGVKERSAGDGYTVEDVTDGTTFGVLHTCESEGEVLAQVCVCDDEMILVKSESVM